MIDPTEDWTARIDVLRNYAYSGADNSISNRLFLRHYWDWCMRFIPEWMAPNLVTVIGMIPLLGSHFLVASYSPNLDSNLPVWVILFSAFSVFFYQTFDNLDGRQARKTGSSSPLGHMFDHCCDCLNITVIGLNTASVLQLGAGFWSFLLLWTGGYLPFFFATWEEYHTGTMVLAQINGPCEGILLIVAIHLTTAFAGHQFWSMELPQLTGISPFFADIRLKHAMPIIGFVMAFVTILINTASVMKHYNDLHLKVKDSKTHPVLSLMTFVQFSVSSFLLIIIGAPYFDYEDTRTVMWAIEFAFWEMLATLILSHLCHERYPIFHPVVCILGISLLNFFVPTSLNPAYTLNIVMFFGLFIFIVSTWTVVRRMTSILQIRVFRLKRKPAISKKTS